MLEALETLGGSIHCASTREAIMYQSATFNSAVPTTLGLLAETIRDPLVTAQEIDQQVETAEYEIREIWSKPELIIPELLHTAAYKDNTLGNPLLCPEERLPFMNQRVIEKYRNTFFLPERMVVAFAGVGHEEAVAMTERYFGDMKRSEVAGLQGTGLETSFFEAAQQDAARSMPPSNLSTASSSPNSSKLLSRIPFFKNISTSAPRGAQPAELKFDPSIMNLHAASHYTGGCIALPRLPPPPKSMIPKLTHIHLAFEAVNISSDDIYALATLQTLLGGGGSFSAGGPGKGMYSRLYTNVLNQHGWVESCVSFNHSYSDSGLFGISASCTPAYARQMLDVMCRELSNLALDNGFAALQTTEVNRAKNQLKSSLLMNLESRLVELEDLGRQIQVHGRRIGVHEMCQKIDALTVHDLRRVAKQVITGQVKNPGEGTGLPTVVIQEGDQPMMQRKDLKWEEIRDRISRWQLGRR